MTKDFKDMISVSCSTVGTGNFATGGAAVSGYNDFTNAVNGMEYEYEAKEASNREVGWGVYNSATHTLTRNVLASTNGGAAVSFAGTATLSITSASRSLTAFNGKQDALTFPNDATKFLNGTNAFTSPTFVANGAEQIVAAQNLGSVSSFSITGLDFVNYEYRISIRMSRAGGGSASDYITIQSGDTNTASPTWFTTTAFNSVSGANSAGLTTSGGITRIAQVQNNATLYMGVDLFLQGSDDALCLSALTHSYFWENITQVDQGPTGSAIGALKFATVNQSWNVQYCVWKKARNLSTLAAANPSSNGTEFLIQELTTTGSQSSATINVPTNYRDLKIIVRGRGTVAATSVQIQVQFNGDSGSNYDAESENRFGSGGNNATTSISLGDLPGSTAPSNYEGGNTIYVFNYAGTTGYKQCQGDDWLIQAQNTSNMFQNRTGGWWRSLSQITSVTIFCSSGAFVDGATISVIGIGKVSGVQGSILYPQFTQPIDSNYAWINQGGASVTTSLNGSLFIRAPVSSSENLRIRKKAMPASKMVTALLLPAINGAANQHAGLCWRESSSGKLILVMFNGANFSVEKHNSPTSFNTSVMNIGRGSAVGPTYLQLIDDGTNRIAKYSMDGFNFITLYTEARTTFMTADEVGYYANEQTNTYEAGITLLSWAE